MADLHIEETGASPRISFIESKGELTLSGKSYPENVNIVYKELLQVIDKYKSNPKDRTVINFNWLYFNTATSKLIVKILSELKSADTKLEVNWYCKKGFNMMVEKGELIGSILDLEINIITTQE